jgi:CoA-transferase family III
MSGGPLAGVRVVDLTTVVVGPTATLYLADYGAEVIKVESPSGDLLRTIGGRSKSGQLSGKFTHFNRNKRSLALDLKQEKARTALDRLLKTADVFIANIRPAALARLGLATPGLAALRDFAPLDERIGSFSSDRLAPDALGMSASLRSRPNLRTAAKSTRCANRRHYPDPE